MSTTLLMVLGVWLSLVLAGWAIAWWLASQGPATDPVTGLLWHAVHGYSQLMHRPTYEGLDLVPDTPEPDGLIVVSNHTGPVDPLVIQAACRFEIRWMMAADMMVPQLDWLWKRQRLIRVDRNGNDTSAARAAIRHVRAGGALGIFPEGAIVRPPCEIRPFYDGAALIIAKTKVPVLLVWVRDTPPSTNPFGALLRRSRTKVTFVERIEPTGERDAAAISRRLRERLARASGWPINDEPLVPPRANGDPFALSGAEHGGAGNPHPLRLSA